MKNLKLKIIDDKINVTTLNSFKTSCNIDDKNRLNIDKNKL